MFSDFYFVSDLQIHTLGANKYEGNFVHVSVLRHFGIVVVDGIKAGLIFQAEDKYDRVNPRRKL